MNQKQAISFTLSNERDGELPVFIEPWPKLYRLRKGEVLKVRFKPSASGVLDLIAHDDGFTVYPNFEDDAEITIDGEDAAHRSWSAREA